MKTVNIVLSSLLFVLSCGKKPEITVSSLTKNQQIYVEQKLAQGVVLKPSDEIPDKQLTPPENRCDSFIQNLPKDFIHDYIEVPEDPSGPDGAKIKVFYYG